MRLFLSFKRQEGVFRAFRPENEVKHSNDPPRVPMEFDGGSFEPIKFFRNFFHRMFDQKWNYKFIDLTTRPKLYELGQHRHIISYCCLLVVHSKKWVCLLKDEKDASIIVKKEDATVKLLRSVERLVRKSFARSWVYNFNFNNCIWIC